jgi:hypothetical protein
MAATPEATFAIVLDRKPAAENFQRLQCLSPEFGVLDCLQRLSRRAGATSAPLLDLFDEAHVALESRNEGRTWFVREATPQRRHTALAVSYEALRLACRFATVLTRNPLPEESRAAVCALVQRALEAWETGRRPDVVYFKSLYLLARDEGHPVREEWWQGLPAGDRDTAESVLRQPLSAQTATEADVARLTNALETYLQGNADMQIGP